MRMVRNVSFSFMVLCAVFAWTQVTHAADWTGGCGGWSTNQAGNCSQLFGECNGMCGLCNGFADPDDFTCDEGGASCSCRYDP